MWLEITISALLLTGVILVIVLLSRTSRPKTSPPSESSPPLHEEPTNFRVFNYLPNHTVRVEVLDPVTGNSNILVDGVPSNKTGGIAKDKVDRYMKPGNMMRVFITDAHGLTRHYTDHVIDHSCYERMKNLHVGMVTTRSIGKSTDGLRMTTTSGNALQGHAWLTIHNLTELPLCLNDDIVVAPHSTERYLGYLHQGVTLGTIFQDQDGIYPDFQYLNPHSDLYYGVVSDLRQPIYGPFQLEYSDDCDTDQTLWPFELGQM